MRIDFVDKNAYTSDHEYLSESTMLGQPFLEDGFLCYFDGKLLTINLYRLPELLIDIPNLEAILLSLCHKYSPETILFWGPIEPNYTPKTLDSMTKRILIRGNFLLSDILFCLKNYCPSNKVLSRYRKLQKHSINLIVQKRNILTSHHIQLLKKVVQRFDLLFCDRVFYSLLHHRVFKGDLVFYELWQNQNLIAFSILNKFLPNLPIHFVHINDRSFSGSSDILYHKIHLDLIQDNFEKVSLGYCGSPGNFFFKNSKWGSLKLISPPNAIVFSKNNINSMNLLFLNRQLNNKY